MVITRFAPSPTGHLHIGGARTALFNWLYAKNNSGLFLLRIEDTDKNRSDHKYTEGILESMNWLGIHHDREIVYQSERTKRYNEIIDKLLQENNAYYCNCSKDELENLRKDQQKKGQKPKYDGRNRDKGLKKGPGYVVRFKTPLDGDVILDDTLKGRVSVNNKELDDLIIQRADGSPTYNLTVVVDDIDMGITNVIRGDDHLNNTFRQVHMFHALKSEMPVYTHIPLILGDDRKRLSKRHGSVSAYDFRSEGILPLSMVNYLARLGWSSGDKEKFTIEELVEFFKLDSLNKSSAIFDYKKLYNINKYFIKESQIDDLYREFNILTNEFECLGKMRVLEIIEAQRDRCKSIKEIIDESKFFLDINIEINDKLMTKFIIESNKVIFQSLLDDLSKVNDWSKDIVKDLIDNIMERHNLKLPEFAKPTRVALTGSLSSPSIDTTIFLLGKERCIKRLEAAKTLIT